MNEDKSERSGFQDTVASSQPLRSANLWKLASKELRETLRDRRTLMTLLLMPILVYPLLGLMFQGFFLPTFSHSEAKFTYLIAVETEQEYLQFQLSLPVARRFATEAPGTRDPESNQSKTLKELLEYLILDTYNENERPGTLEELVASGAVDLAARVEEDSRRGIVWRLIVREGSASSQRAAETIELFFTEKNLAEAKSQIARQSIPFDNPISFSKEPVESTMVPPISMVAIIPLILTLMTLTGAVYPAIDLTAGERERGTLESLIAAPIPRIRILFGKFVAVIAVALLTALLNIIGMLTTLWVFQMDDVLFPEGEIRVLAFVQLFLLLIVFAGFFSSVLLAVTSFARSFKEGQAYLIPVMLFSIGPSLLSLKPDFNIDGLLAVTPLVNIVLLAREILQGTASLAPTLVVIGSTIVYSLMAISFAARIFGTDAVLYGSGGSWNELISRPEKKQRVTSESMAMLCLALLIPGTFLWNGLIGRLGVYGVEVQFPMVVIGMIFVFGLIPLAITSYRRVEFVSGYRLFLFHPVGLVAAILLGLGLGPLLAQAIAEGLRIQEYWFGSSGSEQLLAAGKEQIAKWKMLPWYLLIPGLSVVPGIVEEFFFRGCLFQALRKRFSVWSVILITAIIFGLFHLITAGSLGLSRLLPTTVMGIVLGFVCYRTGSVIPCMVLHSLHNMIAVSLVYFQDDLISAGWLSVDSESVPAIVLVGGAITTVIGFGILVILPNPNRANEPQMEPDSEKI